MTTYILYGLVALIAVQFYVLAAYYFAYKEALKDADAAFLNILELNSRVTRLQAENQKLKLQK